MPYIIEIETYQYRNQTITVVALRTGSDPDSFEPRIGICGVVKALDASGKYPPQRFSTERQAIEYGKQAAEWMVDHPVWDEKERGD